MDDKIATIRDRFEEELLKNRNLYDAVDIERVRKEEWQVKRYLLDSNGDIDTAYQALLRTLAWKASFGLHRFAQADFPAEIYTAFRFEIYGRDKANRIILSESYKGQKKFAELDQTVRNILAYQCEKADRLAVENDPDAGAVYIGDFTDTPVLNLDVPLAKFRVDLLNQHYPMLCKSIVLLNVPFLLKPVIKLIVSFMKPSIREAVAHMSYEQLKVIVDEEVLHEEMKGKRKNRVIPEEAGRLVELREKLGVSEDTVKQFCKYHQFD